MCGWVPFYRHLSVFKFAACFECVLGALPHPATEVAEANNNNSSRNGGSNSSDKWQMHFICCIFYTEMCVQKFQHKVTSSVM